MRHCLRVFCGLYLGHPTDSTKAANSSHGGYCLTRPKSRTAWEELNFQVCIKSFLVFLFFNRTKRGKCTINTTKIYTPAPSFEKMFLLFAARQTLQNMRFDWVSYSSQSNWSNQTSWKREWVFPGVADEGFCFFVGCWGWSEEADVGTDSALSAKSDSSALLLETLHSKSERCDILNTT